MLNWIKKFFDIEPYNTGFLPEQDGHCLFYQQFGNPDGDAVLFFHGGPGSHSKTSYARFFDLKNQRAILFDQRGCGKSLSADVFKNNTIHATVGDAKRLLEHLGVSGKITISGSSYGSTCAILFAMTYPEIVKDIILSRVFLGPYAGCPNISNISPAADLFYPDMLDMCRQNAGKTDLASYYWNKAISDNTDDQRLALQGYGALQGILGKEDAKLPQIGKFNAQSLNSLRIFLHYVKNQVFLTDGWVEKCAEKLAGIQVCIYHNRLDMVSPVKQAYYLHKKLPGSRLEIIPDAGHGSKRMYNKMLADNRAKFKSAGTLR